MTEEDAPCCAASRDTDRTSQRGERPADREFGSSPSTAETAEGATTGMTHLEGGQFTMGTDDDVGFPEDGEGPAREVTVSPFYLDRFAVTNAQFLEFVRETGYTTDAERFGWSLVFEEFVPVADSERVMQNVHDAPWWVAVQGVNWLRQYGPSSSVLDDRDLLTHPVAHVSWFDARAYAEWAGKRLPTEAEWEYAARGGLEGKRYPCDELTPNGEHRCNIWQGEFPEDNTGDDGFIRAAPVNAYEPNGHGLYNMTGNVWEWCADWFSADYHTTSDYNPNNPIGPDDGNQRVMRGGSYLCHRSWCNRYRVAARSKTIPDSSTSNIGFRCAMDGD